MLTCSACHRVADEGEFYPDNTKKTRGYSHWCRQCTRERVNKRSKRLRHGVDKFALLASQQGKCAFCAKDIEKDPTVDHDHACCPKDSCGRCVRGVVHKGCNMIIGLLESERYAALFAAYIEGWNWDANVKPFFVGKRPRG